MRYHNIERVSMTNGTGLRTVLWVAGCTHHCEGCQNPCTWDENGGLPFDEAAKEELFKYLDDKFIQGITFSGGDPLHPANRAEIGGLVKEIAEKYPDKDIWLYTGFTFEEVQKLDLDWLKLIDVLVDGRFELGLRSIDTKWRGSTNQRVINVKSSLQNGEIRLFCD